MASADPNTWLLQFSSKQYGIPDDSGRPWGDGTKMAAREKAQQPPWDTSCRVTPLIGGYETMSAICEDLETAIGFAGSQGTAFGQRGHVYMANWRFNSLRDLSELNSWKTGSWDTTPRPTSNNADQTALGLVLRMLQAGIKVRIL